MAEGDESMVRTRKVAAFVRGAWTAWGTLMVERLRFELGLAMLMLMLGVVVVDDDVDTESVDAAE